MDAAIQTSLMLRTAFKRALRQTEGLMTSVLTLMGLTLSAPNHSTVSRRAVTLPVIRPAQVPSGPLHVLIDSIGLQIYGAGQWGGQAWREVTPDVAQVASGGGCGQRHDCDADADRSGRRRSIPGRLAA